VGYLEGARIESIQQNPKSQASCLQNIKKSLQALKKKNVRQPAATILNNSNSMSLYTYFTARKKSTRATGISSSSF
jgi:uncharacterized alpha-E superfamily protein